MQPTLIILGLVLLVSSTMGLQQQSAPAHDTDIGLELASQNKDDQARSRYITAIWPSASSFARFLLYNAPRETGNNNNRQQQVNNWLGSKRSFNTLDPLAGGIIGKRSLKVPPSSQSSEFISYEPVYSRKFGPLSSFYRLLDMRTIPNDNFDDQENWN